MAEVEGMHIGALLLRRLRHATQALALPATAQVTLLLKANGSAESLVLDFARCATAVLGAPSLALTEEQRLRLMMLASRLAALGAAAGAHLWTTEALHHQREWVIIRDLAADVLAAFDWEVALPPAAPAVDLGYPSTDQPRPLHGGQMIDFPEQ